MAVNCSWADAQVLSDASMCSNLPPETLDIVRTRSGREYLDVLAFISLRPLCTDRIFILYEPLIVEITARWLSGTASDDIAADIDVLSGLARVVPMAPYLKPRLTALMDSSRHIKALRSTGALKLVAIAHDQLLSVLLAWFRLLTYDVDSFAFMISPLQLSSLLAHENLSVRCIATQCISLQMKMSDSLSEKLLANQIPDGSTIDAWEGKFIDYRWLKLFEEERWKKLEHDLSRIRVIRPKGDCLTGKVLTDDVLSPQTAVLANILMPRSSGKPSPSAVFVHTVTTTQNLKGLAQALLELNPILLIGKAGSGKTSLINEAARELNKDSSMITLHLNEQTDTKSLIGLYTTSATGGSFVWQPGILTKAMEEGKWVVIEDIDHAPSEVMGTLLPIINRGALLLPNRRERIRAADGFRVLATIRRTDESAAPREPLPLPLLGSTDWKQILVQELTKNETTQLLREKFAFISLHLDMILCVTDRVKKEHERNPVLRNLRTEAASLRTTLKWCHRINFQLQSFGAANIAKGIPDGVQEDIFMDALDCFAGHLPSLATRLVMAECIAEEMHISPRRRDYCVRDRTPAVHESASEMRLGRATYPRQRDKKYISRKTAPSQPFASTRHSRRVMESMLTAVMLAEPLLLVGETGIGKTAFVQYLARAVDQRLTVINLSQQSESSDLLGGFKPITIRSLALPLVSTFRDLFEDTFSVEKNQTFQSSVTRCVTKQNWRRLLLLWQEATKKAWQKLQLESPQPTSDSIDEQPLKRRRLIFSRNETLRQRWKDFSTKVEAFSAQLSRGDRNFAFAFVEGKIVDAVRNGEWILFDEINLASPDTLDSIATLLRSGDDGVPFLLLPEAGSLERVVGHPSLRIFAAMNPATDTGKKDLAPNLRARFTEIFVPPPDDDLQDLLSVVQTYLASLLDVDDRAAGDLARLYLEIKKLNDENSLVDGAGDRPHFSIRSLVRCLMYVVQNTPAYGLRRAMYEGAAMSFLTVLNKDSSQLILPLLDKYILSSGKNTRSLLSRTRNAPSNGQFVVFKHHWLQQGPLIPEKQPQYIITPFVERNLLSLARATSMKRFPILLQGPTSSGKTSMVEYLAKVSGHHFVRINNHEHTDLQEYLGFYASDDEGKLQYKEGVLVHALRDGHWLVLDELNLAPTDVLEALNRLLDDNRELLVPESQEIIKPHPNFMLFATQNPAGAYGGRKRLSRAFRNRFLEIHFDDIPEDELEIILTERTAIAPSFCAGIVSVYKRLALLRQSTRLFEQRNSFITLRDLFRWAFRRADDRQQLANNGLMLLAERVRDSVERRAVKATIEDVLNVKVDEISLYNRCPVPAASKLSDDVVWTPAMKRLFSLVSEAIAHNEPVLLIGETGCGKTQICQVMARVAGRRLQIYNAHANTETGDLIGAQRPVRHKAEIERQLREDVEQVLSNITSKVHDAGRSLDELIDNFQKADLSSVDPPLVEKIRRQIGHHASLFEWTDGSLVRAMKDGDYFLLDEISLAEDSVLERLNSLLEPERTIFLAEKGPTDSSVVAKPNFQFLATMNPGGDYGKRELSAALRNRFTEIWVPPLTDDQDILPILQSKLPQNARDAVQGMVSFTRWFKASFETSVTTSISLRNLLSWADFVRATTHLTPPESIVHGAAMVYIDTIGANPSGMISVGPEVIDNARQLCLDHLGDLLQCDASAVYHRRLSLEIGPTLRIGCFHINAGPGSATADDFVFDAPTTLQNGMRVVRALQVSKAVLLEGNPGSGKTALITALARIAGKRLVRINLSDQTDLVDLFGADVPTEGGSAGSFSWRNGPLLEAMQSGGWVLLDEMNLASQSILEGLNSCLDHRQEVYISELDRTFQRHPSFVLFAAQNPHHKGGGRKGLPASFINRFTIVYTKDFDIGDLSVICRRQFPTMPRSDLANVLTSFFEIQKRLSRDRAFQNFGGPWDVNLRDIVRWLQISSQNHTGRSPLQYVDIIIGRRFRTSEQRAIMDDVLALLPNQFLYGDVYHNLTRDSYQVGLALLERMSAVVDSFNPQNVPVAVDLPSMEALMLCVSQGWPATLVGPAGCGKSVLLRHLAAIVGTTLIELPMSVDTDIMDLIGGFEQYDSHHSLSALRQELCQTLRDEIVRNFFGRPTPRSWHLAMDLYERIEVNNQDLRSVVPVLTSLSEDCTIFVPYLDQVHASLRDDQSSQMKFQWTDGALIEALERGYWVVLENSNLCSASVLDRLNSLLEPNGSLIISEQHNIDGQPRLVTPHKDFRIFLTVDPRHGELSPAMRNRSLEIHMERAGPRGPQTQALTYPTASQISRIRLLLRPDLRNLSPELRMQTTRISLGHLSVQEHMISHRWQPSLSTLLTSEDEEQISYYQRLPGKLLTQILEFYTLLSATGALSECLIPHQPIRPILNRQIVSDDSLELALTLAWLTDSFVTLAAMQNRLERIAARARNLKTSEMTILESSFHAQAISGDRLRKQPIAESLKLLENAIHGFLVEILSFLPLSQPRARHNPGLSLQTSTLGPRPWIFPGGLTYHRSFLKSVFDFFSDFVYLNSHTQFQASAFQAFLQVGQNIAAEMQPHASTLSEGISNALSLLEQNSPLRYGCSLLRMWDLWRPMTASTPTQLEQLCAVERIANRFDELLLQIPSWAVSYASVREKLLLAWEDALRTGRETVTLVQSLESTVEEMQSQLKLSDSMSTRFFSDEFEYLCQTWDLHDDSPVLSFLTAANRATVLQINAGRKTRLQEMSAIDSPVPGLLGKIARFGGGARPNAVPHAWRRTFIIDLALKANECQDQPLGSLNFLMQNMTFMIGAVSSLSPAITSSHGRKLKSKVYFILEQILNAHKDLFGPEFEPSKATWELIEPSGPSFGEQVKVNHYFRAIALSLLKPAAIDLAQDGPSEEDQLIQAGYALFRVCVAMIYLFVPDQPLDPSLSGAIQCERYDRRVQEFQTKLEALQIFEKGFSGGSKTIDMELVADEISALGERPSPPNVARPPETELPALSADFKNLLSLITEMHQQVLEGGITQSPGDEHCTKVRCRQARLFQENITRMAQRLSNSHRAYADLTIPVMRILQCLNLAVNLVMLSNRPVSQVDGMIEHLSCHTPFLGAKPLALMGMDAPHNLLDTCSIDTRLSWFDHLALRYSMSLDSQIDAQANKALLKFMDQFYQEWKMQLTTEQQQEVRQSKYYSYRGEDENDEAMVQAQMQELFPNFLDDSDSAADRTANLRYEHRAVAIKLADSLMMLNTTHQQHNLKELVSLGLKLICDIARGAELEFCPVSSGNMLPGVMLLTHERWESLRETGARKTINIYTDTDSAELQRMSDVTRLVSLRIEDILVVWPEHSLLHEIRACCKEVLQFKVGDPLAKILTKAEKLHQLTSEWQAMASTEFAITSPLDQLTSFIVSWRKLELKSWNGLLDLEKHKCLDDAKSWFFVAYEALVAIPMKMLDATEDISLYVDSLVPTLESFLKHTASGQFAQRLKLIEELCNFISKMGQQSPALLNLTSSVTNLLQHHKRYNTAVDNFLKEGTTKLVREVEEQIETARWKDTNVTSLRDSARRSHHKLFKIVRKYRALLLQPIIETVSPVAHRESSCATPYLREVRSWFVPAAAARAVELCQQELHGWPSRPMRLRDTLGAAATMRSLYLSKSPTFNPYEEVNSMACDLSDSIAELKSLTPSRQDEGNKDFVQHLKTRKRRLLADVLKNLRHMGVRRNLNGPELHKQSSTARVLSTTPCIVGSEDFMDLSLASNEFHDYLDCMPQIRAALQKHSDELTGSEVTRCVGLAEGLLLVLRKQRESLSPMLANLNRCDTLFQTLAKLQKARSGTIVKTSIDQSSRLRALQQQLHWLPSVLDLGCKVLKIQAQHTKLESSPLVSLLGSRSDALRDLYLKLQEESNLPPGLSTMSVFLICQNAHSMIADLRHDLLNFIERQPHIAYVLRQIIWWTELQYDDGSPYTNGAAVNSIAQFDQSIREATDKIFVALQQVFDDETLKLGSPEDPAWLTSCDSTIVSSMNALHIDRITATLESALRGMHCVDDTNITLATSLVIVVTPIIEQYCYICRHMFQRYAALHYQTCRYSSVLARAFLAVSAEGFCSPSEESSGKQEEAGQIEQGTGLGNGEGMEDIGRDVGEDEDLSELAQNPNRDSEQNETSNAEDAIDMADAELEGKMDEFGHGQEHQEDRDGDGDDEVEQSGDLDEETGSIDDLDPSAVDEKLWNDLTTENEKEVENNNNSGQASTEQAMENEKRPLKEAVSPKDTGEQGREGEESDLEEENEALDRQEQDQLDPHIQEEEILGLPEDLALDGDKNMKDDTVSDDGLDEFSDVEETEVPDLPPEQAGEPDEDSAEDDLPISADPATNSKEDLDGEEEVKGEVAEDQLGGENESKGDADHHEEIDMKSQNEMVDMEDTAGKDNGRGGWPNQDVERREHMPPDDQAHESSTEIKNQSTEDSVTEGVNDSAQNTHYGPKSQRNRVLDDRQADAFKKMGDILEQWHQRREIMKPSENLETPAASDDIEMNDADLEHVQDDADQGDAQALDAATKDQARALDQSKALMEDEIDLDDDDMMPDADEDGSHTPNHLPNTSPADLEQKPEADKPRPLGEAFGKEPDRSEMPAKGDASSQVVGELEDLQDVDQQLSAFQLTSQSALPLVNAEEASRLWTNYSSAVQSLSLLLTEQLRLILAPTVATKLRGDFRTGKRLNIKRIIPYIASGYKRDKIWMRRSVPSKRNYQIMIAVDNSKSMMEGGAGALALESLTLICKSLSMLEVGEICVVGFGDEDHIRIAQPFAQNFTSESGPRIFKHFSFQQTATDVRKLIAESIGLFREAKAKLSRTNADSWQLELIISDGICEDHDTIRRLVRQAAEERIMIVFVIVDSATTSGSSILDLQKASYEPDGAGGEPKLTVKRYLDGFPFPYYLLVGDVRDLPSVLATALKGWFAQVVDAQG